MFMMTRSYKFLAVIALLFFTLVFSKYGPWKLELYCLRLLITQQLLVQIVNATVFADFKNILPHSG